MRILYIEDSIRLQKIVAKGLRLAGYKVDISSDGVDGLWMAESTNYDVIILDLMLPKKDGLTLLEQYRSEGMNSPILILSAKDTVEDKVRGLNTGADDYLVKPFAFEELLARIQALVKRKYGVKNKVVKHRHMSIDIDRRNVLLSGNKVEVPPREYVLLELLIMKKGSVVSRTEIEEHIYDQRAEPMSNVVDASICNLRKIIDLTGESSIIRTVRGAGYIID